MTKIECPKCKYVRKEEDNLTVSAQECPSCGIFYAKYHPPKKAPVSPSRPSSPKEASTSTENQEPKKLVFDKMTVGVIILSLVIGYFSGREHLKYELRRDMSNIASGFKKNMADIFNPGKKQAPQQETKALKKQNKISASIVKKDFRDFSIENGSSAVTITIHFSNNTKKDIRAFKGMLRVEDVLGNTIKNLNISITDPIPANHSMAWNGEVGYNQFIDSDKAFRGKDISDLVTSLSLEKILYQDATTETF